MAIKPQQLPLFEGMELPVEEPGGFVSPEEAALREMAAKTTFEAGEELPGWYGEYEELLAAGWPFRVAMYIAWAATPKAGRKPKSLGELASVMGLNSPRAIHSWRSKNPAIDQVVTMLQGRPLFEARADAIQALVESASNPAYRNAADRRLFFQLVGDLAEDATAVVNVGLTADDMAAAQARKAEYENQLLGDVVGSAGLIGDDEGSEA